MNSVFAWNRWLCLVCVLAIGCNSKTTSSRNSSEDGEIAASGSADASATKKKIPVKRDVKELVGNWVVVNTRQKTDSYRWLIKFTRDDAGKIVAEFLDGNVDEDQKTKVEIAETDVNGDTIRIVFKAGEQTFDFLGAFEEDGFIRGTIKQSPTEVLLSRFLPTDETSLGTFERTLLPFGADVIDAKLKTEGFTPVDLIPLLREYKTSPLAQDMYVMLLTPQVQAKFDEATVQEIIHDFLASAHIWGERWEARVEMTIGTRLVEGRRFARLAPAHLDAAEKALGDDRNFPQFQHVLASYRDAANATIRMLDLADPASSAEVRTAAYNDLKELVKKQPYNGEILFALATEAQKTGQIDAAIEYLSDVVALPLLEATVIKMRAGEPPDQLPNETLKKLWTEKHGSDEGFKKHLSEVYRRHISQLISEMQKSTPPVPPSSEGNRVVLVELFTGMICPPCVSADLVVTAIGLLYPRSQVVPIQYHQHIPGPDGLVNPDSEERAAAFYELNSTPWIVVDGIKIDPKFYSGPLQAAPAGYGVLRQIIDKRLTENSDIQIKVTANVVNGQLDVNADVTGVPDNLLPSCRLRLAAVENHVVTDLIFGSNGIRDHHDVVREILGGAKGIAPKNGELKYSISMPVSDLQQHVKDYITRYEAGRRNEFPPDAKPPISGPMSIVAWVQNGNPDKNLNSRMVLQTVLVPVTGDTGFGPGPANDIVVEPLPVDSKSAANEQNGAAQKDPQSSSESIPAAPALPE